MKGCLQPLPCLCAVLLLIALSAFIAQAAAPPAAAPSGQGGYMPQAAGAMPPSAPPMPRQAPVQAQSVWQPGSPTAQNAGQPAPAAAGQGYGQQRQAPPAGAAQQAATQPGSAPALPDLNFSWSGYFEAIAVLCFVLSVVMVGLWLMRRLSGGRGLFSGSGARFKIEDRLALGPKKWILVVRYQERRLLIGVTDQRINLLCEIPPDDLPLALQDQARNDPWKKKGSDSGIPESGNRISETFASFFDKGKGADQGH